MTNLTTLVYVLPNGHDFTVKVDVVGSEAAGLTVLVVTSVFSMIAVLSLLGAIAISAWNTRKSVNPHMFVRSHAAAYLISLLLCDFFQAVGSMMNSRWVTQKAVTFEPFCQAQGAIKQLADVGTAIWALVMAVHTFNVLFLNWQLPRYVLWATLVFSWSAIGAFVIAGSATMNVKQNGPFYGISGYWCWISDEYPGARIGLDYMFMFLSALFSFILYTLIFLKIRGNILVAGWKVRFRLHRDTDAARGLSADDQTIGLAKQMLLYPVAYTIIILPIAICRFAEWSGADVPFASTIFTDTIYLMSGLVNVALFFLTRRVLPRHSVITKRLSKLPDPDEGTFESSTHSDTSSVPTLVDETPGSYMAEKMDAEAYGDEKVFKVVDSPEADDLSDYVSAYEHDDQIPVHDEHEHEHEHGAVPPPIAITSPHSASRFQIASPETFSRISLDSPHSGGRTQYPASAGGMPYPQSPLSPSGRRSMGAAPMTAPLRSATLRKNLGL